MTRAAISGVLLAAGRGRRFGGNKLLHPVEDGTPMAVAAARSLMAAVPGATAVVEHADGELAGLLRREGLEIVTNDRTREGMGTSIARGVAASPGAQGWVIALADMPFIPAAVIREVVEGLEQGGGIVAPVYNGRRGHPVGFAARHAGALLQLCGDEGARGIIRDHGEGLVPIEVREQGVIVDIDTPEAIDPGITRFRQSGYFY